MIDHAVSAYTVHGAILLGALAAFYKYGDRTEVVAKSLDGTKAALDSLSAYVSYDLGQVLLPLVQTLIESGAKAETITAAFLGEQFSDAISEFVARDASDLVRYGRLLHARKRWSVWVKKLSWAILALLVWQCFCTASFFLWVNTLDHTVGKYVLLLTFTISLVIAARCLICTGVMLYYHDQISTYRENIL